MLETEIVHYDFIQSITTILERLSIELSFTTIKIIPSSINNVHYNIIFSEQDKFSEIQSVHSIYTEQKEIKKVQYSYDISEKGIEVKYPYQATSLDDKVIVNVILSFAIPTTGEMVIYSYIPEIIKEKECILEVLNQHEHFSYSINQKTIAFKLQPKSSNEVYYVIEFAQKIQNIKKIINFSVEDNTNYRTYKNSSNIIISELTHIQGKDRIIMNYSNSNTDTSAIIISLFDD